MCLRNPRGGQRYRRCLRKNVFLLYFQTADDLVNELKTNKKYSAEYGRQNEKALRALISKFLPVLQAEEPEKKEIPDAPQGPNLMNKSLPFMKKSIFTSQKLIFLEKTHRLEDGDTTAPETVDDNDIEEIIKSRIFNLVLGQKK